MTDTISSDQIFQKVTDSRLSKGDRKRLLIVEAALQCLAVEGLQNFSYDNIGQHCGLHRAHINYYFKQKDEIFELMLDLMALTAQEYVVAELRKAKTLGCYLQGLLNGNLKWIENHPEHHALFALMPYLAQTKPGLQKQIIAFKTMASARLTAILHESQPNCLAPKDLKPFGTRLHDIITGFLFHAIAFENETPRPTLKDLTLQSLTEILQIQGFELDTKVSIPLTSESAER